MLATSRHVLLVDCVMSAPHTTTRFEVAGEFEAGGTYRLIADSAPGNQHCDAGVRLERSRFVTTK